MERGTLTVRPAQRKDIPAINIIRKEVNELHSSGRPDIFKPGFCGELQNFALSFIDDENKGLLVYDDGDIKGFAMFTMVVKPESAYTLPRRFIHIEEFGVSSKYKRMGVGTALIEQIALFGKQRDFTKIELDVWEFNDEAIEFYEKLGYKPFRRFMELDI